MSRKLIAGIVLVLAIVSVPTGIRGDATAPVNPDPVTLTSGWQYRWGDSPVDTSGAFAWLQDRPDAGWTVLPDLNWPTDRDEQEWIWYRSKLPLITWTDPALYLPTVAVAFEVYLGTDIIYQFGTMAPDLNNKYTVTEIHVIPLPPGYQGNTVFVRVFSNEFVIGLEGTSEIPRIGSQEDIVRRFFIRGLDSMALGFFFIFAGLFSLSTILLRYRDNLSAPLSFAVFSLSLGVFYIMNQPAAQFVIRSQALKMYAMITAFMLFPIGMYAYLQYTVFRSCSKVARGIIWGVCSLHLGFAVVLVALDLLDVVQMPVGMRIYNILFTVTIPVSLFVTIAHAMRGSTAARIVVWGFAVFGITGLIDLLQGLQVIPMVHWLSQWGALFFVGCLIYILERQFTKNIRQLKEYSVQLEEKSEQLEDYSRTLEDKVTDRTRTLDEKNTQLETTLNDLKDTQQQLLIQEKMASLGNLVAGVAHEVNNPIGAVISASDVSSRCIRLLNEFIEEKAGDGDLKVKKAFDILDENTSVISEAARRVSRIVKSLKDFARLDEAELQKVTIHDGIDNTLTLVKHLLGNRIDVVTEYGDVPELMVFPNQLNQVYMNLIVNAIDSIEEKGTVTIETHSDSLNAYVSVADTGKGIPAQNLPRIFDPGYTTKGMGVGTGLGLSISYSIIQKHDGALSVESKPGKGTTFTIVLPLRQIRTESDQPES
jgi:signal transduction histidine kinase